MPGGFGTMDEIFEVLTLIQTGKLPARPVVCMGKDYWKHLGTFLRETMLKVETISPGDLELALVTDDIPEAIDYIRKKISNLMFVETENDDVY
jgi:predicted Rossmann-fold nucleotide-binding protein